MLFTETWFSCGNEENIPGYEAFHCSRPRLNKRAKSDRGGLSIYYKTHLSKGVSIVKKHDRGILWIKFDKCVFNMDKNSFLCLTYIPPYNSKVHRIDDFDFFTTIENDMSNFRNEGIIFLYGDLNCRTGTQLDFVKVEECNEPSCKALIFPYGVVLFNIFLTICI